MKIRKAEQNDAEYLFILANDNTTRQNSFSCEPIIWENHLKWFHNKLNNPQDVIFIIFKDNNKIGVVKFEFKNELTIGVTISPEYRGGGLGSKIIKIACLEYWKTNDDDIFAYIKDSNIASLHAFKKADFNIIEKLRINNNNCTKLIAQKCII